VTVVLVVMGLAGLGFALVVVSCKRDRAELEDEEDDRDE
jgi:hypothetical protein